MLSLYVLSTACSHLASGGSTRGVAPWKCGRSKSSYEGIEDEGQHDSYCDHPTGVYTDWRRAEDGEDEASLAGLSNPDTKDQKSWREAEGSLDDDSHSFSARVEATASCVREGRC